MRITKLAILFFVVFLYACNVVKKNTTKEVITNINNELLTTTPHPEWRETPNPVQNQHTSGPISFMWPVPKKNRPEDQQNLSYDFILSEKKDLSNPIIAKSKIEWAFVNTHSTLNPGNYYWQYKTYKNDILDHTSQLFHFIQTKTKSGFETPNETVLLNNIPKEHPRLLAQKNSSPYLKNYKEHNSSEATIIIKKANSYFGIQLANKQYGGKFMKNGKRVLKNKKFPENHPKAKPTGRIFYTAISTLAKAYLLTGEEKYAQEGIRWARKVADFPIEDTLTKGGANNFVQDDFDIAVLMPTLAIAFDTFYKALNQTQKNNILNALIKHTEGFYQYYRNRLEARVMDNHAWQHTFSDFLRASIALSGETPEADKYLAYAYGVWVARFPVQSITDGGWTNGKYVSVNFQTWTTVPLYIRRYTGVNYYEHPFFKNQVQWLMVRFPPKSYADGFGGDGFEEEKSLRDGTVTWLNILNAEFKDPKINWYLRKWGKSDTAKQQVWERMSEGLKSDHKNPNTTPKSNGLKNNYLFEDTGMVNIVENWDDTKNSTSIAFRSAPWGNFGHNLPSNNAFNIINAGEPIFFPTGFRHGGSKHSYEWYRNSRAHNTLMVNGKGQPVSSHAWGQISKYIDAGTIVFAQGDASMAYSAPPSPQWLERFTKAGVDWYKHVEDKSLKTFKRNLVYIKPGIAIVYDEVKADTSADWDWRFHSPKKITIHNQGIQINTKKTRAQAKFFAANKLKLSVTDTTWHKPYNVDGRMKAGKTDVYKDIGWHLNVHNKGKNQYLLTVIDVANKGVPLRQITTNGLGKVNIAGIEIEANLDPDNPASLQVKHPNGKVLHLLDGVADISSTTTNKLSKASSKYEQLLLINSKD